MRLWLFHRTNISLKRVGPLILLSTFLLTTAGSAPVTSASQTHILFGPEQFTRTNGATNVYARSFSVPSSVTGPYTLQIKNGRWDGKNRLTDAVSSGTVSINDVEIIHPSDFNQNVAVIERTVTLNPQNSLTVTLNSAPDSFIIVTVLGTSVEPPPNLPPVARAGSDRTVAIGTSVQLDGRDSFDPDGGLISYAWTILEKPTGSLSELSDPVSVQPTFTVDREGIYWIQLIVNDGLADSLPDEVVVTAYRPSTPPTADAGPDQNVLTGSIVLLNGAASFDPEGDVMIYQWSIVQSPVGSTAQLSDPASPFPSIVADLDGEYRIRLIVNDGEFDSLPDEVVITASTPNRAPTADAGLDQTVSKGTTVHLDGSGSHDPDGDPLTYQWTLVSKPAGSDSALDDPTLAMPSFMADRGGEYVFHLAVSDGEFTSGADAIVIVSVNHPPVANAGSDQTVMVGTHVLLNGNGSSDSDGDTLTFNWNIISRPLDSGVTLTAPTSVNPNLTPDVAGTYTIQLVVNDGEVDGPPDEMQITVIGPVITALSPDSGPIGMPVTITGLNFDSVPSNNHVKFNGASAIIASATPTTIQTVVPQGATNGPVTVTTPQGTAASPGDFTVTPSNDFALIVDPPSTAVVPQGFGLFGIRLAMTGDQTPTVSLSVNGLPGGVTAQLLPPQIAGPQASFLALTVDQTAATGTFLITLIGTAVIDGQAISHQAELAMTINPSPETSFMGLVLDTDENPIKNATLTIGSLTAITDAAGLFFFSNPPAGDQLLTIDGATADTATASYPLIWAKVTIQSGIVNPMPYIIFLREQKNYNFTDISNEAVERVVTDPEIPGFEMTIPAGVRIIGWDGQPNQKVSVQQLPIDRLPVRPVNPADNSGMVYMFYFGKQGGGLPDQPIPVTLPNDVGLGPGEQGELWYFDEAPNLNEATFDWKVAGAMTASQDGLTVTTDPGVGIPRFCCGAIRVRKFGGGGEGHGGGGTGADPIYLNDGTFRYAKTDLMIPGRIPMAIRRVYNPFGVGGLLGLQVSLDYDAYIESVTGSSAKNLILPGEVRFLFSLQSDGTYQNTTHPRWNGAMLRSAGSSYELEFKDGTRWTFQLYAGFHFPTGIEDRNGNRVTLTRDSLGRITEIRDDLGRGFSLTYIARYLTGSATDHLGRTVSYGYDSAGRLSTVTDPAGGITRYEYDGSSVRISAITDARGIKYLQNFYGASGRVLRQVLADGSEYRFTYALNGVETSTGPNCKPLPQLVSSTQVQFPTTGNVGITDYYMIELNRYLSQFLPDCPSTESWEMYELGYRLTGGTPLSTTVTDPNGNVTSYRFNDYGYQTSMTDALSRTTVYERESVTNRLIFTTDPLTRKTAYAYNAAGNVTSITDAEGNTTCFEYDPTFNRVTKITDAIGNVTAFSYDTHGNLISTTDPLGNTTTLSYNAFGQPISVTDPLGNTTQFEYDTAGNLSATVDPMGNRTTRTYDEVSRLIALTDPLGHSTSYAYDSLNRVISITDARAGVTGFGYDPNGNLLTVTDANGNTTTHTYDVQDRLATRTDPLGHAESYQYDGNGNLTQFTDRKGQVSGFTNDALNHRTQSSYTDGSSTAFTYDAVSRLTQVNDTTTGLIQMSYDDLNRLTQELTPQGVVSYGYDAIGRRTSMSVNGLTPVAYQYDNASRLTQVAQGPQAVNLGYDTAGRRTSLTYPNGTATNYFYDTTSRLTEILHQGPSGIIEDLSYTYDAAGNRISFDRASPQADLPQAVQAAYNAANQMVQFNTDTLTYDANGNLMFDSASTYSWDARNRLVQMSNADLLASFSYDALGRRVSKTINGETTQYLYDGNDIVAEIQDRVITATYLRSLNIDEPFLRSSAIAEYYHTDALGSTLALTDQNGIIQASYSYDPFGNTTIAGTNTNPFQYTGRENDNTGLYYYRTRYYSPSQQRFISEDKLLQPFAVLKSCCPSCFAEIPNATLPALAMGNPELLNAYNYVRNNPLTFTDPYGLTGHVATIDGGGGGGARKDDDGDPCKKAISDRLKCTVTCSSILCWIPDPRAKAVCRPICQVLCDFVAPPPAC